MMRFPVITLHSVDSSGSVVSTAPADLERILQAFAAAGWRGASLRDALRAWSRPAAGPPTVGLCFDDGYRNVVEQALPVMRDLGFTATVFVVAARCGLDNRWPGQPGWVPTLPLLGWPDLGLLLQEGWEIGSHGLSHLPLAAIDATTARREIRQSRQLLESELATTVACFAYPYGIHDAATRRLVGDCYAAAFGVRLSLATAADLADRLQIPRIDAYYLRRLPAPAMITRPPGRAYLAVRRWGRALRAKRAPVVAPPAAESYTSKS